MQEIFNVGNAQFINLHKVKIFQNIKQQGRLSNTD